MPTRQPALFHGGGNTQLKNANAQLKTTGGFYVKLGLYIFNRRTHCGSFWIRRNCRNRSLDCQNIVPGFSRAVYRVVSCRTTFAPSVIKPLDGADFTHMGVFAYIVSACSFETRPPNKVGLKIKGIRYHAYLCAS